MNKKSFAMKHLVLLIASNGWAEELPPLNADDIASTEYVSNIRLSDKEQSLIRNDKTGSKTNFFSFRILVCVSCPVAALSSDTETTSITISKKVSELIFDRVICCNS